MTEYCEHCNKVVGLNAVRIATGPNTSKNCWHSIECLRRTLNGEVGWRGVPKDRTARQVEDHLGRTIWVFD
jgi:hypothetical protein